MKRDNTDQSNMSIEDEVREIRESLRALAKLPPSKQGSPKLTPSEGWRAISSSSETGAGDNAELYQRIERIERRLDRLDRTVGELEWRADRNLYDPKSNKLQAYLSSFGCESVILTGLAGLLLAMIAQLM